MKNSDFQQLNIIYVDRNRAWSYCPYHNDKIRPNLSISLLDKYYGRYRCWACGKTGRLSESQMRELNMPKGKRRKVPAPIDWWNLILSYHDNYKPAVEGKVLAYLWNVYRDSLSYFIVGWDGEAYTFPMYNSNSEIIGIQRRWPQAVKGDKCCIAGSQLGLFLPIEAKTDTVFITEGISDAVSVYDIGFDVIGKPCATFGDSLIRDFIQNHLVSKAVIIPDNNDAGEKSCKDIIKAIKDVVDYSIFRVSGAKDIREYILKRGKQSVRKELFGMV